MKPYYQDSAVTIYHADCLEVMDSFADSSVDIVFTSPPYNMGEGMEDKGGLRVGHSGSKWNSSRLREGYGEHLDNMPYSEYVNWQRICTKEMFRVVSGAVFYNHKPRIVKGEFRSPIVLFDTLPIRQIVIWDRGSGFNYMSGAYMPMCEWILIAAKPAWSLRDKSASGVGDVWRIRPSRDEEHPCAFPISLPLRAIETSGASSVLDPFCGIGTTLLASKNLGRKAIGIELEERYCEIAAKRMAQEVLAL